MSTPRTPTQPRTVRFRLEREERWRQLERMVTRSMHRGPTALERRELHQLPHLYREALASLSVARATAMDRSLVAYLDSLSSRAWLTLYASREPGRRTVGHFLWRTLPRTLRGLGPELCLSAGLLMLGMVVAMVLVGLDPEWYFAFVSPDLAGGRTPWSSIEYLRNGLYDSSTDLAEFSARLFSHNSRVGLLCFALGAAAGLPTAYLLFSNGLMLGAFLALYSSKGLLFEVGGWLLPHGVPEIGGVLICGAAGLSLGRALVLPGRSSRIAALGRAGRRASLVAAGTILLFACAGVLEGVFRQEVSSDLLRYLVGVTNLLLMGTWFTLGGRDAGEPDMSAIGGRA